MGITKNLFGAVLLVSLLSFGGCGGGSSSSTPSVDGATVTGTILAPSATAASLSAKNASSKALTDTACTDCTCTVYNLDGDTVGTGSVNSSGEFSISADFDNIRPASAEGETSYTAPLIVVAENADGSVYVATYIEVTVDESSTTTISVGEADSDTTLAAEALRKEGGCAAWGQNCAAGFSGIDAFCYFKAQEEVWSGASVSGGGLADDLAAAKDMVVAAMANGELPSSYGFESWGDLISAHLDGDLPAAAQTAFASHAASAVEGADTSFYTDGYSGGASAFRAMDNICGTQLSGSGSEGAVALASLGRKQVSAESGSACDSIKTASGDNSYTDALIGTFLACDSASECNNVYADDDCFKVALGVMEEFKDASDLSGIASAAPVVQGYVSGLGSAGCDDFFAPDGSFDATNFDAIHDIIGAFDPTQHQTHDAARDWGRGMQGIVENLDGGLAGLDAGDIAFHGSYLDGQVGDNFDPTTVDFAALTPQLEGQHQDLVGGGGGDQFTSCIDAGGTFESCGAGPPPNPDNFEAEPPPPGGEFGDFAEGGGGGGFGCVSDAECSPGTCVAGACGPPQ